MTTRLPISRAPFDSGLALSSLIILALAARIILYLSTRYVGDDAMITFRYADNLSSGSGFVFNKGERVQGTSSPLLTLLLAAGASLSDRESIPSLARFIGLAADAGSILILWIILSELGTIARFLGCALFALYPKVVLVQTSGMETPLLILLMVSSFLLVARERTRFLPVLFLLLLLCRVDTVIWIVTLAAWILYRRVRVPLGPLLAAAAGYGAWIIFCLSYFGSWLPHSVVAKTVSWNHLFPTFDPVRILAGYFPFQGLENSSTLARVIAVVALLAPVITLLFLDAKKSMASFVFPLFFLLYNLAFAFGRVLMTDWYFIPGYCAYFIILSALVDRVMKRFPFFSTPLSRVAVRTGVVIALCLALAMGIIRWNERLAGLSQRQNRALGQWLNSNAAIGDDVLVEPIGYIGWESGLYIHDYIGLVSPKVVETRKRFPGSDRWYAEYLRENTPEFVVQRNWEFPHNSLFHGFGDGMFGEIDREWFTRNYSVVDWNASAHERDSVFLVLFKHIGGPP